MSKREYTDEEKGRYYERIKEVRYDYYSISTGQYIYSKYRLPNKIFPQGRYINKVWHGKVDISPEIKELTVFCSGTVEQLKEQAEQGGLLVYCEGEKDVLTCKKYNYLSFTTGSKEDWKSKKKVFQYLTKAKIVVFADNDHGVKEKNVDGGIESATKLTAYINSIGGNATMIIPPVEDHQDISDYMMNHNTDDLKNLISQALDVKRKSPAAKESIYDRLVRLKAVEYERNDKGFSKLFSDVFADTHRYNSTRKDWMYYNGKVWINDSEGMQARQSAKQLTDELIKYTIEYGDDKQEFLKSVMRLSSARARESMIKDSRDNYFFTNESLDTNDYILNVENGTLDLSDDEPKFIEHNSDMLLSKIAHVEYDPSAVCPLWDKFLIEIMQGDKSKIEYLQKIAGLSLTGDTSQESMFILYGSTTRNGKSSYIETLLHLLGDYATTMQPQSLAQKQNTDSRQASGDIARLNGCRLVNASESPKKMLFDTSLLKSLLGRDSITARHIHEREFTFIPKFKLLMNTNYLPQIADDTVFSSGRINVISFDRHFEPHEQDKQLKSKLLKKKELSGILNWMIAGLRLYRQQGLNPPEPVLKATEQYRSDSDKIGSFISECLQKSDKNSKAKDIYELYSVWCSDNGFGTENKANFFSELKSKGLFMRTGTVDGKTQANVVKGYVKANDDGFVKCNSDIEDMLFD